MGLLRTDGVHESSEGLCELAQGSLAHLLGRTAVSGQVESVDGAIRSESLVIEKPVVEVAAETVNQNRRIAALTPPEIAQGPALDFNSLGRRAGRFLVGLRGHETCLESSDKSVDVRAGDRGVSDQPQQSCNGHRLAHLRHMPQDARFGNLETAGDFLRFYFHDLNAGAYLCPLLDEPSGDLALRHREPPFGHSHFMDGRGAHALYAMSSRTVVATLPELGM